MVGEISGLGCALFWALSSVMIKTQTERIDAIFINAFRCAIGSVLFAILAFSLGKMGDLTHAPPTSLLLLAGASLIGFVVGDTMYYRSMGLIGVSRTLPISGSYPIFTLVFAITLFGESVTRPAIVGSMMVVAGVYLVAFSHRGGSGGSHPLTPKANAKGVVLALMAALSWAFGTNLLKAGMENIDAIAANALRMPLAAIILMAMATRQERGIPSIRKYGRNSILILLLGSIVGTGGGSMLFVISVKYAGAAKAAVLSSVAPLLAVPASFVLLRERITMKLILGALLSVAGIWLILAP
ncbi:MAG: DMT family transporter [bacterium]